MEEIIQSIYDDPQYWEITSHRFVYKKSFNFWVANGFIGFAPYESGMHMTFGQKVRAWKAFKWWCKQAPIEAVR